jgi:hypothetical protein
MKKQIVLVIGDLHSPAMHIDTVRFLKAIKKKFKPNKVILTGDEINFESFSYHEHNPDLPGAADELHQGINALKPIYKLFPVAQILESNHTSLVYRKQVSAGLPSAVMKGYREILQAPKGWTWHFDLILKTPQGPIYFHHGKSSSIEKLSKNMSMHAIQGHYHSKFYVSYWANPNGLFFDANAGTFADHHHLAMAYAKNSIPKGIHGVIVITNGVPQLIPMVLDRKGRWNASLG